MLFRAAPASAGVKAGGYLKNFWQYSHSAIDGRAYNLNTARARLTIDAANDVFKTHVDYDHQIAAGTFFRTRDFQLSGYDPPKPWLDMEQTISTGATNAWGHGAYRAWVGVEGDASVLRAGRQRIAWGTGKLWNPTDVLNAYNPVSVERDERRGVDALYGRLGLGALGQAEMAWAPNENWPEHSLLTRGRANWEGWDASLLGGKISGSAGSHILGGDFAGAVFDGTLHGELAWFNPEIRTPYWKAGLGYDYTFPSETRLIKCLRDASFVFEWYHMGNGQTDKTRYDFAALRAGREVGVGRNYAGATFSKDLDPLLKFEAVALVNADDASTFFMPSLTWNALNNLYLSTAFQRFGGESATEYGGKPNAVILTAQYWF